MRNEYLDDEDQDSEDEQFLNRLRARHPPNNYNRARPVPNQMHFHELYLR